jgi:hypothetical protein
MQNQTPEQQHKRLSEYLKEKFPDIDLKDVAEKIKAYKDFKMLVRSNVEGFPNFCDICFKKLTDVEHQTVQHGDFSVTCEEHRQFKNMFNVSLVRERLGIAERPSLNYDDILKDDFNFDENQ